MEEINYRSVKIFGKIRRILSNCIMKIVTRLGSYIVECDPFVIYVNEYTFMMDDEKIHMLDPFGSHKGSIKTTVYEYNKEDLTIAFAFLDGGSGLAEVTREGCLFIWSLEEEFDIFSEKRLTFSGK